MGKAGIKIGCPIEDDEQKWLFEWAELRTGMWPELRLMYHVPNEGKRSVATAVRFKKMGLKSGVPDICLPVARCGCHALYIELKREKGGRVSDSQCAWLEALSAAGNMAVVCRGWAEAAKVIEKYLKGEYA